MPVFFSFHSDIILCVLCCALLLAGVICMALAREAIELPGRAAMYLGIAIIILAAREWEGIIGVSDPAFVSFYPVAAMMQTAASLAILLAARIVTPRPSRRATALGVAAALFLLGFAATLLLPYLSYTDHIRDGKALISVAVFFFVKFTTFAAACILFYCILRSGARLSRSTFAALSVLCLHTFIIFVCRPPGLAGLNDQVDVFATPLNVWLFIARIVTAFILVAILWNQYSRAVGVTRQIRWWPLALTVFILCTATAFVFASSLNYRSVMRRNLIAAAEYAAMHIQAPAVRLAAADPSSLDSPSVAEAVFGPVRHNRIFRGYAGLACALDVLAVPPGGSGVAIPLIDVAGAGGRWARSDSPLQTHWQTYLGRTTYMPEGMDLLEPLLVCAPIPAHEGSDAGLAILSVSAVDLILDQYLFKRPILLFIPIAFFCLLLLMSGQQRAWLAAHSSTRIEALRRGALSNGLTGIVITQNHIIVDCNERAAALAGIPRDRLLGVDARTAFDVPDPSILQKADLSLREPAGPKVFETPLRRPDGATVHLLVYGRTQSGDPNDPCCIWESVDVTVTKEMEKELRQARDYLQLVLDTIPVAVFVKDHQFRYTMLNRNFAEVLGVTDPQDIIGKRLNEIDPDHYPDAEDHDRLTLSMRGDTLTYDRFVNTLQGRKFYEVTKTARLLGGDSDEHPILIGCFHDMTNKHVAAEAVRAERHFLRQLIDTIPVIICFLDTDCVIRLCDREFCREAGAASPDDVVGRPFDDVLPFGRREEEEDRRLLEQGQGHADGEFEAVKDGRRRNFMLRRTVMSAPDGKVLGLVKAYWDVTPLVAANYTAKKAERAKAAFLANMSHELRTPMNGIVGMADLIIESECTQPLPRLYAETIVKSAKTLQMVMDEVMDVATIDDASRRLMLAAAPFPMLSLVEEAVQIVSCIVEAWGVDLSLDYDFALPAILDGDARHVRQVMVQILTHCSRLTSDKRVRVEVAAHADGVAFRCVFAPARDIGAEELEDMFKRTADTGDSARRFANLGIFNDRIGLPLAWRLIDAMSGSLAVEQRDGRIRCEALLPLSARGSAGAAPVSAPNLSAMRILAATGDPDWRRAIENCLAYAGATVECAADFDAASELLRRGWEDDSTFDAVLLDAHLADLSGNGGRNELLEWISRQERYGNPAVALIVCPRQVQELAGCSGNVRCLMVPPLCPSELWYKLGAIRAARNLEKTPGGSILAAAQRRPTRITRLIKVPASVLLVEDNTVNQMVAMGILKRLGCTITLAKNGREAVDAIAAGGVFDVILMDCMMPVMDGYEATEAIRLHERNIPGHRRNVIVALTANTVAGDRERCLAVGMDDYITKPVTLEQVRDTMARLCPELVTMVDQAEGA